MRHNENILVHPQFRRDARFPKRLDALECGFQGFGRGQDRKSTRLNSSHLVISYAVFCLKKKKTIISLVRIGILSGRITDLQISFLISSTSSLSSVYDSPLNSILYCSITDLISVKRVALA